MSDLQIIVIGIILFAVAVAVLLGYRILLPKVRSKSFAKKLDSYMLRIYSGAVKVPIVEHQLKDVKAKIRITSIYSAQELNIVATKDWIVSSLIFVATLLFFLIAYQDLFTMLIGIIAALVLKDYVVTKRLNKIHEKVYKELKVFISSLRMEYMRIGSITDALQESECGETLRQSVSDIENILTSVNGELKMQEFLQKNPFRTLQILARVCYNINNVGDEKNEYGQSNFVQALSVISTDINSELIRVHRKKIEFRNLEYLTLFPIPAVFLIHNVVTIGMPGTKVIYDGVFGYAIQCLLMVITIGAFKYTSGKSSINVVQDDDRSWWSGRLLKNRTIKEFVEGAIPRNAKRAKVEQSLHKALSKKSIHELYLEKIVYALVCFLSVMVVLFHGVETGRQSLLASTETLSFIPDDSLKDVKDADAKLKALDEEYFQACDENEGSVIAQTDSYAMVRSKFSKLTDVQIGDQVNRLETKYNFTKMMYFHWWFVVIALIFAFIAYKAPNIILSRRAKNMSNEAETDFLQLQTLMMVLMYSNCDVMDALEQLTDISKIHKDMLLYCYHGFPSNPELELSRLESRVTVPEFKRFVSKLKLCINDLSLREAYDDLATERDYINSIREQNITDKTHRDRIACGLISTLPVKATIALYVVLPLMALGGSSMQTMMTSLSQL